MDITTNDIVNAIYAVIHKKEIAHPSICQDVDYRGNPRIIYKSAISKLYLVVFEGTSVRFPTHGVSSGVRDWKTLALLLRVTPGILAHKPYKCYDPKLLLLGWT